MSTPTFSVIITFELPLLPTWNLPAGIWVPMPTPLEVMRSLSATPDSTTKRSPPESCTCHPSSAPLAPANQYPPAFDCILPPTTSFDPDGLLETSVFIPILPSEVIRNLSLPFVDAVITFVDPSKVAPVPTVTPPVTRTPDRAVTIPKASTLVTSS